jgi:ADP-ribose pyrophosphatase
MRRSPHQDRIFEGVRFDLYRVAYGGGDATIHREVVVPSDAVVIVPLLDPDTVVLIHNRRPAIGKVLWELPAGTREDDEPADAAAARELAEETGYRAGKLTRLTAFYAAPGFCTERLDAYLAEDLSRVGQTLDATEEIAVHPTPVREAMEMIRRGTIEDAKTIATLLYYQAFGRGTRTAEDPA